MKFVLLVEGHTERVAVPKFLKRWLDPQLKRPVKIQTVRFEGWPELVKDLASRVSEILTGPANSEVIAVVGLLDLYGPDIFPPKLRSSEERRLWAVEHLQSKVRDKRFHLFFAVHEVEAWLLSQPTLFDKAVLSALPRSPPEAVNFDPPRKAP